MNAAVQQNSQKRNFYSNSDITVFEMENLRFSSDCAKNPLSYCEDMIVQ